MSCLRNSRPMNILSFFVALAFEYAGARLIQDLSVPDYLQHVHRRLSQEVRVIPLSVSEEEACSVCLSAGCFAVGGLWAFVSHVLAGIRFCPAP
jgi:hypothetical protein